MEKDTFKLQQFSNPVSLNAQMEPMSKMESAKSVISPVLLVSELPATVSRAPTDRPSTMVAAGQDVQLF